jgi:hypothetical protein
VESSRNPSRRVTTFRVRKRRSASFHWPRHTMMHNKRLDLHRDVPAPSRADPDTNG